MTVCMAINIYRHWQAGNVTRMLDHFNAEAEVAPTKALSAMPGFVDFC